MNDHRQILFRLFELSRNVIRLVPSIESPMPGMIERDGGKEKEIHYHSPEYKANAKDDGFEDVPTNIGSVNDGEALPRASWIKPRTKIAILQLGFSAQTSLRDLNTSVPMRQPIRESPTSFSKTI